MSQVKIAIIGLGNMGNAHIHSVNSLKTNCRLTAVCDWNPEKLKNPGIGPDVKKFTNDDEFFKDADFDALIIAVPHYQHVSLAIRAMEFGKHVMIEKPISVHKKLALELVEAVKQHPELKVAAMFNQRTTPALKKIKQMIEKGELGALQRINWINTEWFRTQSYYDSGDWRATWRGEGGGVLLNQCPHQLDQMQWLFGMPKRVTAMISIGKYHNIEVEDDVTAMLEYESGATGVFIASTGEAPGTNRLEVTGQRGRLVLENGKLTFIRNEVETAYFLKNDKRGFALPERWNVEIPVAPAPANPHAEVINAFAEWILHGTAPIAEALEGLNSLELGNAILLSGLKHKTVEIPMDAEEFAEELDKLVATSNWKKPEPQATKTDEDFTTSFKK